MCCHTNYELIRQRVVASGGAPHTRPDGHTWGEGERTDCDGGQLLAVL